jgi:hypothetical protein
MQEQKLGEVSDASSTCFHDLVLSSNTPVAVDFWVPLLPQGGGLGQDRRAPLSPSPRPLESRPRAKIVVTGFREDEGDKVFHEHFCCWPAQFRTKLH